MNIRKKAADAALCGLFAALIAIGAFIKLPIPYVPITLQTFFAVLSGLLLGARRAATAAGIYVCIGLLGVPVFSGGGGIGYVLHPTFGYLIGMVVAAYLAGRLISKKKSFIHALAASAAAMLAVYVIGVPYLYMASRLFTQTPIGLKTVLLAGFLTPLPGDIVKCVFAALLYNRMIKLYPTGRAE